MLILHIYISILEVFARSEKFEISVLILDTLLAIYTSQLHDWLETLHLLTYPHPLQEK